MNRLKLLLAALILLVSVQATAAVITIESFTDAQIVNDDSLSDINLGNDQNLITNWGPNPRAIGLVEFDLSAIISGATITSALLGVYHITNRITDKTYSVFQTLSAWDENTVTFDSAPSVSNLATASLTITDIKVSVWREWEVTSLVQDWVGGSTNYGFWLEESPSNGTGAAYFASSDYRGGEYAPYLTVEYEVAPVPIPATIWLFGTGLLGLIGFSRRRDAA